MPLARRFRLPALFCALAVLVCELIARPCANMGISDDGPYILMARTLATTGHIAYNGWAAPMLGWQLYLGAAFIKLFGYSLTTVRMSTLLIALLTAFLLQRTLVRAGITERNATIGTLALVLSPLYLMMAATFITDIPGLFAIVLCLYGCLRALQSSSDRRAIAWLCFAVVTNALFGTARQIAWLGVLVMVPSALWLLRARRRVFLAGAAATLAGALFIFACMQWLKHQPYVVPSPLLVKDFPVAHPFGQLGLLLLDIPFLLLPIFAMFLPEIRKSRPRIVAILSALLLGFLFVATYPSHLRGRFSTLLEPTGGSPGSQVGVHGVVEIFSQKVMGPIFLGQWTQVLLTIISFGGLVGLIILLLRSRKMPQYAGPSNDISWQQLGTLFAPFTVAYILLLVSAAATATASYLFDRYTLGLLVVVLLLSVRFYQQRVQPRISLLGLVLVLIMAIYGVAVTRNNFSFYRARVALANELQAAGVPATSVDNGWEFNLDVELQHADHISDSRILVPANAHATPVPPPTGICPVYWNERTPHIHALYGVSFDPNACYGPAPFAPVHYSRWPYRTPGTLYVVRYTPAAKP